MTKTYLKLVIVGHVDHGKSTLIGRLLYDTGAMPEEKMNEVKTVCESLGRPFEFAFLLDYMEEERQKNITIDTTQIFFKTSLRDYVIIDAPGHKEFLKNMITGSSQAEAAILIVDANEGIKEQTKRHAYLLSLLGLKQIVVVINKMDLVGYKQERFEEVKTELLKHLDAVNLKPSYIIPISAALGDNIANKSTKLTWYTGLTVLEALDTFTELIPTADLPLRLPIQDVYNFDNQKIYAGQIESGKINQDQDVMILPSKINTKIKEIKQWNKQITTASHGENIGVTFQENPQIGRGDVICQLDALPKVTNEFSAKIFWMSPGGIKENEPFLLKLTTQEVEAKIKKIHRLLDSSSLETIGRNNEIRETEVAEVEIATAKPMVIESYNYIPEFGRFVIIKNDDIVAGGIIT